MAVPPADVPLAPEIAAYDALVGRWADGSSTESWLPLAGVLVGVDFSHGADGAPYFEVMSIRVAGDGVDLTSEPDGAPPVAFHAAAGSWRFANPNHDFPQWVEYRPHRRRLGASIGDPEQRWRWRRSEVSPDLASTLGGLDPVEHRAELATLGRGDWTFATAEVSTDGTQAFAAGVWSETGAQVVVWRRESGTWRPIFASERL